MRVRKVSVAAGGTFSEMSPVKSLALLLAVLMFVVSPALAQKPKSGSGRPKVYNHITSAGSPFDKIIRETFATKFDLVDLSDSDGYTRPKLIAGAIPTTAKSELGLPLKGYVLAAFIVATDGRVTNEVILRSTDERLHATILNAMRKWRFEPALRKGIAISTTAVQVFEIQKP